MYKAFDPLSKEILKPQKLSQPNISGMLGQAWKEMHPIANGNISGNQYQMTTESYFLINSLAAQPNEIPQEVIESGSLNNHQQYGSLEEIQSLVSNENQVITQQNEIPQEIIENDSLNNSKQYRSLEEIQPL
ncbi:9061_t:CDS:2, partial [Ambispora leptoticha]